MFLRTKSGLVHFGNCEAIHWYSSQGIGSRHCSVKCPLFWWHLPGSVVFSCRSAVPSLFSTGLVILEICFVYYPPVRSQQITVNCSLYTIPIHLVNLNREIFYSCIQTEVAVIWNQGVIWVYQNFAFNSMPLGQNLRQKQWSFFMAIKTVDSCRPTVIGNAVIFCDKLRAGVFTLNEFIMMSEFLLTQKRASVM